MSYPDTQLAYGSEGGPEALDVYLNTRSVLIHND